MSKVKKRCIPCEHKLECLGTNVCTWDKKRVGKLQQILDSIGNSFRYYNSPPRGIHQVSLRMVVAYHKFDREFRGSRNQRRGDAILFMKKHARLMQRWRLNQKRTAFICDIEQFR